MTATEFKNATYRLFENYAVDLPDGSCEPDFIAAIEVLQSQFPVSRNRLLHSMFNADLKALLNSLKEGNPIDFKVSVQTLLRLATILHAYSLDAEEEPSKVYIGESLTMYGELFPVTKFYENTKRVVLSYPKGVYPLDVLVMNPKCDTLVGTTSGSTYTLTNTEIIEVTNDRIVLSYHAKF